MTDANAYRVYRLRPGANEFELFASGFLWPNGIVTSADERTLYDADFRGIHGLSLTSKSRRVLETDTPLNGIDGLIEHRGTLIGIHNVLGRPRVVRVRPGTREVELLESKSPALHSSATGVAAGEGYVFMGNLRETNVPKRVVRIPL